MRTTATLLLLPISGILGRSLPPAISEDEWVGKTDVNYTRLHKEYGDTLVCMYIPVGVFGFYAWLLVTVWLCVKIGRISSMKNTIWNVTGTLVSAAYSSFILYGNMMTIGYCHGSSVIRGTAAVGVVSGGFSLLGDLVRVVRKWRKCAILILGYAIAFNLTIGPIYFGSVLGELGLEPVELVDLVRMWALIAVCIPVALIGIAFVCIICSSLKESCVGAIGALILGVIIVGVFFLYAMGTVLLGEIVGDPWGGYIVADRIGVAWAVLAPVMPFFEAALSAI